MTLASVLAADGHTTTALVDHEVLARLRARFDQLGPIARRPFFASANDLEPAAAARVHRDILDLVAPALAAVLPGYRPFLASFLAKSASDGARIDLHQDLSYTDERSHRTVVAWVPLVDVDAGNGALALVGGSHRWTSGSRPGGIDPLPTAALQDELAGSAELVPLEAGHAVLYDAAVVHGSPPNGTTRDRVAVGVALVPIGAELVHLHRLADGGTAAFVVDDGYYTDPGLRNLPVGYPEVPAWAEPVTEAELRSACVPAR